MDIKNRENEFVFPSGRAKFCKKDSCYPPLCTKREATSGNNFNNMSSEEGEARDPSPDLEAGPDFISIMWDYTYTYIGIMLLQWRNFMFLRTIFRYLWIISMFRDKQKQALKFFKRRPSMIIGTGMETRHCLNHGSVWDVSRRSRKIHQKDICGFKADWRRNGSQQDQETRVRKSGQTRQEAHSVKPYRKWAEAKPLIGGNATRGQRGIYSFPNNARRKLEIRSSAMPCRVTTPANPDGSSLVRPCASKLSKMDTKRLKSSCSTQEHENILIESERIRTTKSRITSGMEVTFPCRTTTWCTNRFPYRSNEKLLRQRPPSTRNEKTCRNYQPGTSPKWSLKEGWHAEQN